MTEWPVKTLGEVAVVGAGNSAPQDKKLFKNGVHRFVRTSDVGQVRIGRLDQSADLLNDEGTRGLRKFRAGVTLMPKSGASTFLNHRVQLTKPCFVSSHLAVVDPNPKLMDDTFMFYFLQTVRSQDLIQDQSYPSLNLPAISGINVLVPPLDEQKRLVALLDAATTRVTELTACYEQARTHTNNVYISALTDLFEKCTVDVSAKELSIGEICEIGDGNHSSKYPKSSEFVANGVPFIRANNISNGKVSAKDMRFISKKKHNELKKGHLRTGDVLITNRGEIGSLAIVGCEFDGSNLNSQIAWLRVSDMVANRYLYYFLGSPNAKAQFFQGTTGAALQQLTISQLRKIQVPIVPLNTQKSLIDHLDKLKRKSSEMVSAYDVKLTAAKNLRQSILEAAFTGQL